MRHLILAGLLVLTPAPVLAQFGLPIPRIPGLPGGVPIPPIPGLDSLLREEPPVSTALADAKTEVSLLDGYNPRFTPMAQLQRGENGSFRLKPGTYEFDAQSYCLHAGTHGPGTGEGYLYAPLKGKRDGIIRQILQRSTQNPQIAQRNIQMLLWAILARTKISDLSSELQATARQLLTQDEINRLNGGAWGQIPPEIRSRAFASLPGPVRQVLNAEANMRSLLSSGNASYSQLEQLAVLAGNPGRGEGSRDVPANRWSYHPSGFFIRYTPDGYSRTKIQISLPDRYTISRDNKGRITAIADQQGNRIETQYDDTIAPRPHPRNPNLQAYVLKSVRFARPASGGQPQQAELQNRGWVFVNSSRASSGVPNVGVLLASLPGMWVAQGDRFTDWANRAEEANEWRERVDSYRELVESRNRRRSQQDVDDLGDLGHYRDGIEAAVSGSPVDRVEWVGQHQGRMMNALEYAICVLDERCSAGGSPNYDPSGDVAVPGNTSRQRLGQSARAFGQ